MKAFYEKHYVAKNMAIILTGNFKAKEVLPIITEKFKNLSAKVAPSLSLPELEPLAENLVKKIRVTPIKIEMLGWQTAPFNHKDRAALDVCERMLSNESETGLMDQLAENNEVMFVFGISEVYNKAGAFSIIAVPKPLIQSVSNTDKKIEAVLNKLKNGDFSADLLNVPKYELSKQFQQEMEQLSGRGVAIGTAFSQGISWEEYIAYPKKVSEVSKEEVMRVAKKYFGKKRAKLISRTGFPKKVKLEKPPFKAVSRTQKDSSVYAKNFKNIPSKSFQPKFLDFDKDIEKTIIYKNQTLIKTANPVNDLFYLTIAFKKGYLNNLENLNVAVDLMNYSGAGDSSYLTLKKAFSNLGCSYYFSCNDNYLTLKIEGIPSSLDPALELVNLLIKEPRQDESGFKLMLKSTKLDRKVEKRDRFLLGSALYHYAQYNAQSYFLLRASQKEIKKMSPSALIETYKRVVAEYKAEISYVGNLSLEKLKKTIESKIDLVENKKEATYSEKERVAIVKNKIIIINDKKAIQSHIYFYVPDDKRDLSDYVKVKAFNNYFAGGFSGIITQEIREYRSLAYAVGGRFVLPIQSNGYFSAYIGCQADKTIKATAVLDSLLNDMPEKQDRISSLKKSLKLRTVSNYPEFKQLYGHISYYQKHGYTEDPNIDAYQKYENLSMKDVVEFYEKAIKGKPRVITIYGNKNKMDLNQLEKLGQVEILQLKEVIKF
jgi:zinc protease